MTQLISLEQSDYWNEAWTYRREIIQTTRLTYEPVPPFDCPVEFNTHVLAIALVALDGKSYWNFGGFLNQNFEVGFSGVRSFPAGAINKHRLYLNRWQILVFQKLTLTYTLNFEIPFWFKGVDLTIMQFTGPHYDPLEGRVNRLVAASDYNREIVNQIDLKTDELLERQ